MTFKLEWGRSLAWTRMPAWGYFPNHQYAGGPGFKSRRPQTKKFKQFKLNIKYEAYQSSSS